MLSLIIAVSLVGADPACVGKQVELATLPLREQYCLKASALLEAWDHHPQCKLQAQCKIDVRSEREWKCMYKALNNEGLEPMAALAKCMK